MITSAMLMQLLSVVGPLVLGYFARHIDVLRLHKPTPAPAPVVVPSAHPILSAVEGMVLKAAQEAAQAAAAAVMDQFQKALAQPSPTAPKAA